MTAVATRMDREPEPAPALAPAVASGLQVRPGTQRSVVDTSSQASTAPTGHSRPGRRTAPLPDPATWSATLVRAVVEMLKGQRPAAQLIRWVDADLWTVLDRRARARRPGQAPTPVRVRRVHGCVLDTGIWECSVVIDDGGRMRAVALRLEVMRGRWCATALQIG